MGTISKVPVAWNGSPVVGGGFSVLYCTENGEHALMAAFRAMMSTAASAFPSELQWTFSASGVTIDETSGDVDGDWVDATPVSALNAGGSGTWVNGVGTRVKWTTGAVYEGRHVVGSTFLVPLLANAYEGAGNIQSTYLATLSGAINTFVGAAGLRVYSRPRTGVDGLSFAVNGFSLPDKVSWLRGRRT